jgi:hypothetical protein
MTEEEIEAQIHYYMYLAYLFEVNVEDLVEGLVEESVEEDDE